MNNKAKLLEIVSLGLFEDQLKFTKMIFELQKRYGLFNYAFIRRDYGPYSEQLVTDLEELASSRQIELVYKETNNGRIVCLNPLHRAYSVTLLPEVVTYINSYKLKSRKEVLYSLFNKYDIFQYEIDDVIR